MLHAIQRNGAIIVGAILAGFLGAVVAPLLVRSTGASGPGMFFAQSPILAFAAMIGVLLVMMLIAAGVGRLTNAVVGLFVLGAGVFMIARRGGTVHDLVFGGGPPVLMVVELLLWAVIVFGATLAMFVLAGRLDDIEPPPDEQHPHPFFSREAMMSALGGAAMIPVIWIIAQSPMKGQALAAAILGGLGSGLAGRLLSPHVQPMLLFASPLVFAALGQAASLMFLGRPLEDALIAGAAPSFAMVMPLDLAAGALLGVSMGFGWAKSFLHHEEVGESRTA